MPWRAKRACLVWPCPNYRPCPRHPARDHRLEPSARTRFYGSSDWKRIRAQVLQEEPFCGICGAEARSVDHVVSKGRGGGDARANLWSLCIADQGVKSVICDGARAHPLRPLAALEAWLRRQGRAVDADRLRARWAATDVWELTEQGTALTGGRRAPAAALSSGS
jgi:5-methylcytosine-specific restriction protein A